MLLRPRGGIEGLQRVEVEAQGAARESWGEGYGLRTLGRLPEVGDAFTFRPDGERLVVEAVDAECVTLSGGRRVPLGSFLGMVGEGTFVKMEP